MWCSALDHTHLQKLTDRLCFWFSIKKVCLRCEDITKAVALAISWISDSSCSWSNTSSSSIKISLSESSLQGMFDDGIEPRVWESLLALRIISNASFLFLTSFNGFSFGLLVAAELVIGLRILAVSDGTSVKTGFWGEGDSALERLAVAKEL